MSQLNKSLLTIRNATPADVDALVKLGKKVYGHISMTAAMIRGQINNFSDGQFVAVYDDEIVGHCATFVIEEKVALGRHTWMSITGNGFASRHNPDGDYLYGMEVCVDQDYRNLRIGQRLYDARKRLCQELELKGIVFGGRLPGYAKKHAKLGSPQEYIRQVTDKLLRDPVLNFQISNGYEILGILKDYLPSDTESMGFATHMLWKNPILPDDIERTERQRGRIPNSVRIATVQLQMRKVDSFRHFIDNLEYFVDVASGYKSDFVTFPELFTLPLLSYETKRLSPAEGIARLTEYTDDYISAMQEMAVSYNINIIGGTHPSRGDDGEIYNVCYVFLRDGSVHGQAKLHPTPNERYWWNIKGGNKLEVIPTDCGPIGVQICYDSEFPEPSRHLADQGALMLFVPFCTDERQGYLRVRYCAHARAVENQMYVVTSGTVGNLPSVENMDVNYAESFILTPCDFPFARDGIAASCDTNTETIAMADLSLESLMLSRHTGTVQNLKDRRFDLYNVRWKEQH